MKDTPDHVARRYEAMLLALPPGRRVAMALRMFGTARALVEAGLRPQAIHHLAECTRCRADLYPSYRRDGAAAGRMISFVGFRAT